MSAVCHQPEGEGDEVVSGVAWRRGWFVSVHSPGFALAS